jgi:hypothetical protein
MSRLTIFILVCLISSSGFNTCALAAIQSANAWYPPSSGEDGKPQGSSSEGLEFKTLISEQSIAIPEKDKVATFNLGVRVTNHSKIERKLLPFRLRPIFVDRNQRVVDSLTACAITHVFLLLKDQLPFKTVKPGESIEFLSTAYLDSHRGKLTISYNTFEESTCIFYGFTPGRYSVSMQHDSSPQGLWFDIPEKDKRSTWRSRIESIPVIMNLIEKH